MVVVVVDDVNTDTTSMFCSANDDEHDDNNNDHDAYRIALYYCYVNVVDVDYHMKYQENLCHDLHLHGRIRVAKEGLNGVLSGTYSQLQQYETHIRQELQTMSTTAAGCSSHSSHPPPLPLQKEDDNDDWELDVKYCELRLDLPVSVQLFHSLSIKVTTQVVSLVDLEESSSSSNNNNNNNNNNTDKQRGGGRHRRQRRRKQIAQQQEEEDVHDETTTVTTLQMARGIMQRSLAPPVDDNNRAPTASTPHLSPSEWNQQLSRLSSLQQQQHQQQNQNHSTPHPPQDHHNHDNNDGNNNNVVLLDCRNCYESDIGYFAAPHVSTILTNTRKYSELPAVLIQQADRLAQTSHIFMVRSWVCVCVRAKPKRIIFITYSLTSQS